MFSLEHKFLKWDWANRYFPPDKLFLKPRGTWEGEGQPGREVAVELWLQGSSKSVSGMRSWRPRCRSSWRTRCTSTRRPLAASRAAASIGAGPAPPGTTVGVAAPGHQWAGCSRAVSDNGQEEGRVGRWGGWPSPEVRQCVFIFVVVVFKFT